MSEQGDAGSRFRAGRQWGPVPEPPPGWTWRALMEQALELAREAATAGEVPVGALVVDDAGTIVGCGRNETERSHDPSAHAEVLALRRAAARIGNHRLGNCVLVATLEPCLMCTGAIREARVRGVVYGACDERAGAVESRLEGLVYADGPAPWHMGGVESGPCADLLREFFRVRRAFHL